MRSLGKTLRSRRLAIWLLGLVVGWSVLGTVVPQLSEDPGAVMQLSQSSPLLSSVLEFLGLYHAYTAWPFLAVLGFLTLSTLVCARERTGRARGRWREAGSVSGPQIERLRTRPTISHIVPAGGEGRATSEAAQALAKARLKVRKGEVVAEGVSGRWGLLGSPVFHWSLALLIIVVGAGALTRSEGLMGVAEGEEVPDAAESYGVLTEGPLFPGHTDLMIRVDDLDPEFMDGDVDRGEAPVVTLLKNGTEVASQRVHANEPLRHGWTTIHSSDYGYAPTVSLESSSLAEPDSLALLVDFIDEDPTRTTAAGVDFLSGEAQIPYSAFVVLLLDGDVPRIEVTIESDEESRTVVLEVGEFIELSTGARLVFDDLGFYSRLSVVHDWSVPLIYALFGLGLLGVSVAVLDPYRRVLAMSVETERGAVVHLAVVRGSSALFEDRLTTNLDEVFGSSVHIGQPDHEQSRSKE